jgi:putative tryptophan/tyrosine transport system substrate-binding protein
VRHVGGWPQTSRAVIIDLAMEGYLEGVLMLDRNRRGLIALLGGAVAASAMLRPLAVEAQQSKAPRIGVLALTDRDGEAFSKEVREGMRALGLIEGQNYALELPSAEGKADRLTQLAQELVRAKVDIIAAIFTPCALAAKAATRDIPIFMIAGDPVGTGLVASLARPGDNVTGLSNMGSETAGKTLELFRDILPSLKRVAVLANPVDPFTRSFLEQVQLAGRVAGIEIGPVEMARSLDEVEAAFAAIAKQHANAVVVQGIFFQKAMADLAIRYRLPSAAVLRSFAEAGGLLSYGADIPDLYRRSAVFVAKVLQGAKPAALPVEQPTKFELVINLKTAKAIGVDVPLLVQQRADEVIE